MMTATAQLGAIFICASEAPRDRAFTHRLARDIRRLGYTPLFHRRPGVIPQSAADIERAQAVLVVLSPQLPESAFARTEYLYAVQHHKRIIPLQIAAKISVPPELAHIQWVDFYELYERGLANLTQVLGRPQQAALRRVRRATLRGRVLPFIRTVIATLMMATYLLLFNNLFGQGSWILALPVAIFIAVGQEDYRHGETPRLRITLARILAGAAFGALLGLFSLFVVSSATAYALAASLALIGGLLAWLFTWLEQRSLSRGRVGAHRALGFLGFSANAAIIFLALITSSTSAAARPGFKATAGILTFSTNIGLLDPLTAVLVVSALVAVSVLLAGTLQWLQSPVHRVQRARSQLVESNTDLVQAAVAPSAASVVFISHASGDNDFAVRLSRDLQRRRIATWVDRRQLRPGMLWPEAIRQSLDSSQTVLLVLSPLAVQSEWVRQEYQMAVAQHKQVLVLQMDASCLPPPELQQAPVIDFATLYVNGLADLLAALHAGQQDIAAARRTLRQRLRYAWLISTVRLVASSYLFLARIAVFAAASFILLGGFDHVTGVDNLATYALIWLGRALPGAALGLLVSLEERARVEGARRVRWMSIARVVNGVLTGEGLLGVWSLGIGGLLLAPATWLAILFLINQSPGALVTTELAQHAAQRNPGPLLSLIISAIIVGVGVVNGALAIPLARSEQRNRELGKHALSILTHIAGYSARIGIGALGLVAPLYLFFDSPIDPLGPPPQAILGGMSVWVVGGLAIGAIMGAVELFFFPAGPSRRALRKLRAIVLSRQENYRGAL